MKAFWLLAKNIPPNAENINRPDLPELQRASYTNPCDIYILSGISSHVHLLVGGFALPDDNLAGQQGEGHSHLVVKVGDVWHQVTRSAAHHTHPLNIDGAWNMRQDYFLLFMACTDADYVSIAAHPSCYPIVEAAITPGAAGRESIGDLDNTPWPSNVLTMWQSRILAVCGFQLPPQVDRGARLVAMLTGALVSRSQLPESSLRFNKSHIGEP